MSRYGLLDLDLDLDVDAYAALAGWMHRVCIDLVGRYYLTVLWLVRFW